MRVEPLVIARMRALFGVGFIVLGALTLWRVATTPVPNNSKTIGIVLAVGLAALGVARIVQYVRVRNARRA